MLVQVGSFCAEPSVLTRLPSVAARLRHEALTPPSGPRDSPGARAMRTFGAAWVAGDAVGQMRADHFAHRRHAILQRQRGAAVLLEEQVLVRVDAAAEGEVGTGEEALVVLREDAELEHRNAPSSASRGASALRRRRLVRAVTSISYGVMSPTRPWYGPAAIAAVRVSTSGLPSPLVSVKRIV